MTRRMRQHEVERLQREAAARDVAERRKFWHNVFVVKVTVMVSFIVYLITPAEYKDYVALSGNLLWLWRT